MLYYVCSNMDLRLLSKEMSVYFFGIDDITSSCSSVFNMIHRVFFAHSCLCKILQMPNPKESTDIKSFEVIKRSLYLVNAFFWAFIEILITMVYDRYEYS